MQVIQKLVCTQCLCIFLILKDQKFIGKNLSRAIQKVIDEFRALGPSALDCCNEDGVIYEIP